MPGVVLVAVDFQADVGSVFLAEGQHLAEDGTHGCSLSR